jgi:hypothetical protein
MTMNQPEHILEGYIPENEFCDQLQISPRTSRNMRTRGEAPTYMTIAGRVFYSLAGIREWLINREKKPTRARQAA